jgi:hypothetical protein
MLQLYLFGNSIHSLPPELFKLENLTVLSLLDIYSPGDMSFDQLEGAEYLTESPAIHSIGDARHETLKVTAQPKPLLDRTFLFSRPLGLSRHPVSAAVHDSHILTIQGVAGKLIENDHSIPLDDISSGSTSTH